MRATTVIRHVRLASICAMLCFEDSYRAHAASYTNTVFTYGYSPANRTIGVGDTIVWRDTSGTHTVTGEPTNSPAEPFCGDTSLSVGMSCSHTYLNAGRFGYYCTIHGDNVMSGFITVTNSANTPPPVSLTNPVSGAKFKAPALIPLKATASDLGGSVTNVQFFSGTTLLGNVTVAPYNFNFNNASAGNYSFTARAVDNQGATTTSAVVNVFVFTNATLTSPTRLPGGQFRFTVQGISGQTYASEFSSNLVNWSAFSTSVAPASTFSVTDGTSTNVLRRFYRARQDL